MKRVILLGVAGVLLFGWMGTAAADRLPENPLTSCGDCRDHGPGIDELIIDGDANYRPPGERIAPDHPDWLTRIALRLVLLASIR